MIGTATFVFISASKEMEGSCSRDALDASIHGGNEAAKNTAAEPLRKPAIVAGTWRRLCVKYFGECADYKRLDPQTQHVRRLILESTFDEPIAPGSAKSSVTCR